MARLKKSARVLKWRGDWWLFFSDASSRKQRRLKCASLGASNAEQRKQLEREYRSRELNQAAEVQRRGGALAYDTLLTEALDRYLTDVAEREAARAAAPASRAGLAATAAYELRDTIGRFQRWQVEQRPRLATGELDGPTLGKWARTLTGKAATRNKHLDNLRACVNWLARVRPPLFPDVEALRAAFRELRSREDAPAPVCYPPAVLRALLVEAIERDSGNYVVPVKRFKGGKVEEYEQPASSRPAVPLTRLVLLLALTGARRGEVVSLRWDDVDLDRGRLTIHAEKTGRRRVLPLAGAPEGDVAPRLLELMKRWKLEAGGRPWVLPHEGDTPPAWPETAWRGLCRAAEADVRPQGLRQTWCAVAASMGWPPAVAALAQGHAAAVAERWYRSAALDREKEARDFEEALGLAPLLDRLLAGQPIAREATA